MRRPLVVLWIVGTLAGLLAGLSIVDMALPKPYDGVVLEVDAPGRLLVRQVVPESGAARAGILPGDEIVGIAPLRRALELARRLPPPATRDRRDRALSRPPGWQARRSRPRARSASHRDPFLPRRGAPRGELPAHRHLRSSPAAATRREPGLLRPLLPVSALSRLPAAPRLVFADRPLRARHGHRRAGAPPCLLPALLRDLSSPPVGASRGLGGASALVARTLSAGAVDRLRSAAVGPRRGDAPAAAGRAAGGGAFGSPGRQLVAPRRLRAARTLRARTPTRATCRLSCPTPTNAGGPTWFSSALSSACSPSSASSSGVRRGWAPTSSSGAPSCPCRWCRSPSPTRSCATACSTFA